MKIKTLVLLILVSLLLTGCLVNKKENISEIESQQETGYKNAELSGSFVVTVRDIIPDYCLDDFTPQVGVVTQFQSRPFTVYLGEKLASEIEVGKTYTFTVEKMDVGRVDDSKMQQPISPVIAFEEHKIKIENIRLANEDEKGLNQVFLKYNSID